jgi:hypothetical protein
MPISYTKIKQIATLINHKKTSCPQPVFMKLRLFSQGSLVLFADILRVSITFNRVQMLIFEHRGLYFHHKKNNINYERIIS